VLGDWGADYPYGQTSPPSKPVITLFPNGDYPTGEIMDYHHDLYGILCAFVLCVCVCVV
jgi:hypothetical protein